MANPYHDETGRFCSGTQMLESINALARASDVEGFLRLRGEYEQIRRDIRFGRITAPGEYDAELKQFAIPVEAHPRYPLADSKLLPLSRVRRGLNGRDGVNQLLAQLDNEARGLQRELSPAEKRRLALYAGIGSGPVNAYLRGGEVGVREYLLRDYDEGEQIDEQDFQERMEDYLEIAQRDRDNLDQIFANHHRAEQNLRVLHRTIALPAGSNLSAFISLRYPVGEVVQEKSYLSTSVDSDNVLLHAARRESRSIVFEILSRSGLPLHRTESSSGFPGAFEREVLLPRDVQFEVLAHGKATYETTHADGRPSNHTMHTGAKNRHRFDVIQLRELAD